MRKTIYDVVISYYKAPVKFTRNFDSDDESPDAPAPIRDLVNSSGPMAKNRAANKSVDFSKGGTDKDKAPEAKLIEIVEEEIDLGNERFNKIVEDVRVARDRIMKRIVEKSPDEDKSVKSKKNKRKSKNTGGPASAS